MEDMIAKIIEMDQKARELEDQAQQSKLDYEKEIVLTREKIKTDFLERAKKRISINRQTEQKKADEELKAAEEANEAVIQRMDQIYAEKHQEWVDQLVQRVLAE